MAESVPVGRSLGVMTSTERSLSASGRGSTVVVTWMLSITTILPEGTAEPACGAGCWGDCGAASGAC